MTSAATAASPPRSAVELHQELALEAMEAKIASLAQETKAFLARESSLPEVPKFQGRTSKARQTFEHFDADGSGTIDYKEVEVGLRALGLKVDNKDVRAIFDEIDADGSGLLELSEFGSLLEKVALLRQGRAASGTRGFEQQSAAVRVLSVQAAERPLQVLAEGEVRTLVRCATADHPAVVQQALSALATLAEAALPCAVAVVGDRGLPAVLAALGRPPAHPGVRRQGARLLAALAQEAGAANEAAARRQLRLSLYASALPPLLALGEASAPEAGAYCAPTRLHVAQALAGLTAEPELAAQLGDLGRGAALRLCCRLADANDAETRLHAVLAIAAAAATPESAWALVGFGALRPLLLASALADPPMISDAAQQALARCHWREQWMGAQYVDPLARLPAEVRARRANTDSVAGAGGRR
jgi:hypothetical protein